jgi:NOL1/NOP2/fmu family ribosome biogenesis protein
MRELPDLKGIKVFRAGLHLGEIRGKIAIPDHAAALCFQPPAMPAINVSPEDACRYMAGETIDAEADGWTLIQYRGLYLGWGKGTDGMIKNHYPKGLRGSRFIP